MTDTSKRGTRTLRPAKIRTDARGRSVWADPVSTAKFELVTTQELRAILSSGDAESVRSIEDMVETAADDGVLARNAETGMFQIIDETDLQAILDSDSGLPAKTRPADVTLEPVAENAGEEDRLALVSTQALRRIIRNEPGKDDTDEEPDIGGGFDPYNTG